MDAAGALDGEPSGLGVEIFALGHYWQADRDERTDIGWLVHRAKDRRDPRAARELAERFAALAVVLGHAADGSSRLVVPVPSNPAPDGGDRLPVADLLADSLASAGAGECRRDLVVKTNATARLRHLDPGRRAEVAASACYRASAPVTGRHVVVVDDVVLTGATVAAVAACLHEAGAASVAAAVAARSRLG